MNQPILPAEDKLPIVTSSPHVHHHSSTRSIMGDVIISLFPALLWGIYVFGLRALVLTGVSILSCVLSELLYEKIFWQRVTVGDLSAVVTGLLLALSLPVSVPLWLPAIGGVFAIVVVKMIFGGIGKNVVNPALAARVFLFLSFPSQMSRSVGAFPGKLPLFADVDAVSTATPLAALKNHLLPEENLFDLILGTVGGSIGETSAILLTLGFVYLLIRRVVKPHIPLAYLLSFALLCLLFPQIEHATFLYLVYELFSGGLLLGAFFMATDTVTSPITLPGKVLFGIGCGILTFVIRTFGGYAEGVSFAILMMNLPVWYLDLFTRPTYFGQIKKKKESSDE